MTTERAPESAFPTTLEHKHGLDEWWPMMAERSAETIEPGQAPTERIYRCQKVGCTEVVRIGAGELKAAEAEPQRAEAELKTADAEPRPVRVGE